MTEREFLDQQMEQSSAAMWRTSKLLGKNLGRGVDPRGWTKSHPWISLSVVAIAGFVGISLIPRRHKQPTPPPSPQAQPAEEKEESSGLWHSLLGHAFKIASRWIAGVAISNLAKKVNRQDSQTESESQEPAEAEKTAG